MRVKNIQEVNEAIIILRHFVDLSARLLPILYKIDRLPNPTEAELNDKKRILAVFKTYNFETKASNVLIESNVLELIKNCYLQILYNDELSNKENSLVEFLNEYNRLKNNWRMVEYN